MPQNIISSPFFLSNILQQWFGVPKTECRTAPLLFHSSHCRFTYCIFPLSSALTGDLLLLKILWVLKLSALCYSALTKFIWYNMISSIFSSVTNVFLAGSKSPLILKYLEIKRQFYTIFFAIVFKEYSVGWGQTIHNSTSFMFCRHQNLGPDFQSAVIHQSHRIAKADEGETRLKARYVTYISPPKHWKDWAETLRQKLSIILSQ